MTKIWTDEKKQQILEMRNAGQQYKEIAEYFETTTSNISSVVTRMKKEGYNIIKARPWTEEEELYFLELREEGHGYEYMAEVLNKSYDSIKKKASELVKAGIIETYRPTLNRYTSEELIEYIKQYISCERTPVNIRHAVKLRFGSWTKGLEAAGISGNTGGVFDSSRPTILYFLDFGEFQKIGITQQQIKSRFSGAPDYKVLDFVETDLDNAIYLEKELKKVVKQYIPEHPWFERNGKTECFKSSSKTLESLFSADYS